MILPHGTRSYMEHPIIETLRCTDQDHLLVASGNEIGKAFFQEAQEKYGFQQSDPDMSDPNTVKAWNSKGKPIKLPNAGQTFSLATEVILKEYVETIYDPIGQSFKYLEKLGFKT